MNSLHFLRRETYYLSISLVFALVIFVFTSCLQSHMTFILVLTLVFLWKSAEYFLDISKAFDREWHDGLLFKLKQNGVSGNLLGLIKSVLSDRVQRVTLNGKTSDWECI